jgi:hypothetical protein
MMILSLVRYRCQCCRCILLVRTDYITRWHAMLQLSRHRLHMPLLSITMHVFATLTRASCVGGSGMHASECVCSCAAACACSCFPSCALYVVCCMCMCVSCGGGGGDGVHVCVKYVACPAVRVCACPFVCRLFRTTPRHARFPLRASTRTCCCD